MLKSLASLRFVFAFLVFMHHINVLQDALGHAFFYALSGFILSYVYAERFAEQKISLSRFLKLRLSRLYPLYVLTLLTAIPLSLGFLASNAVQWALQFVANLFMLQSFIPNAEYYFAFNSLGWSISDLFFFYTLFPVLLWGFRKYTHRSICGVFSLFFILILSLMYIIPQELQHWFFYINPLLRLFDFALGMLLYQLLKKTSFGKFDSRFTWYEIGSLILLVIFYASAALFPKVLRYSVYYWLPMLAVIGVFAQQKGALSKLLSKPVLLFLGNLSFGFYLWHQLILRYARRVVNHFEITMADWQFYSLSFILILLVCYFSYRFFELPMKQKLRRHF